ncbi:MAG: hypothetical protein ACI39Q_01655 [Wujia sp.]
MEILNFTAKGNVMEKIKSVEDFKKFPEENRELLLSNAVNVDEITIDDEWIILSVILYAFFVIFIKCKTVVFIRYMRLLSLLRVRKAIK